MRLASWNCAVALVVVGCQGPPGGAGVSAPSGPEYSPAADAAVNPPELFEPFPFENPERADENATLMLHSMDSPESLNPLFLNTWSNGWVRDVLFDLLVFRNEEMESEPNFEIVESWEVSEDRRATTVTLKDNLRWQDGEPFTSADLVFSWKACTDVQVPAVFWQARAAEIGDAEIIDDRTVRFTHKNPTAIPTEHLYFPIVPEHIWNNPEERAADPSLKNSEYHNYWAREELVGNGPYRFVEWVASNRIVLERWDDYPGPRPHFQRIVLKIQPDRNTALLLFKKGELDEIWLTVQQFATQTNDESFLRLGVKAWGPRSMYANIGWNLDG
jgi:peptide/nickel transport system substrate-binding protein